MTSLAILTGGDRSASKRYHERPAIVNSRKHFSLCVFYLLVAFHGDTPFYPSNSFSYHYHRSCTYKCDLLPAHRFADVLSLYGSLLLLR